MTTPRYFCSETSREAGEQLFGTASRVDLWLLLEVPHPWGSASLPDNHLPAAVREHTRRLIAAIPKSRQLVIRNSYGSESVVRMFVVHSSGLNPITRAFELSRFEDVSGFTVEQVTDRAAGRQFDSPMFLVCTHGKHDQCCAKFGLRLFRALHESVGDEAWECSHVGGDRFAGNLVCLPHGLYYGHVDCEDVRGIAEAYRHGTIYLPNYRGRSAQRRIVQVAEYYARLKTGLSKIDDLREREFTHIAEGEWRVGFDSTDGRLQVHVRRSAQDYHQLPTCKSETVSEIAQYELVSLLRD